MNRRRRAKNTPPPRAVSQPSPPGLLRRLAALAYDALLLLSVWFAATLAVLPLRGGEAFRPHDPAYLAYLMLVGLGFLGWFWTHGGQTLGMRAWKIKIVAEGGGALSWKQAALRYVCAWASLGLLGLGFLWIGVDSRRRAWHDLASGTRMVREG